MFTWSLSGSCQRARGFARRCGAGASLNACLGFFVKGLGDRRRTPLLAGSDDFDLAFIPTLTDTQYVPGGHFSRYFHLLAGELDLAALDSRLGQRSSLEKTGGPQPLIDPDFATAMFVISQCLAVR